jgi:hypothetical protein
MRRPKTHFEQVPLEVVREIVEEQIRRETIKEPDQGTTDKTLENDLFGPRTINGEAPHIFSRGVIEAIHESQQQENQE